MDFWGPGLPLGLLANLGLLREEAERPCVGGPRFAVRKQRVTSVLKNFFFGELGLSEVSKSLTCSSPERFSDFQTMIKSLSFLFEQD